MSRILVTGAGGMLGQDVVRLASLRGHDVGDFARADLDITNPEQLRGLMAANRPEVVVNCAAYTNVDGAEADEKEATRVNGEGAGLVAEAAALVGARLIHVGSDYVFSGDEMTVRSEQHPVGPRSAYGRSKLAGEGFIADAGGSWVVIRSAWLYGAGGRNFVDVMREKCEAGESLRVVADQTGSPTWSVSLANAILNVVSSEVVGILHFANRGAVTWHALAQAIADRVRPGLVVEPIATADLDRPAPRPVYSALDTSRYTEVTGKSPLDWKAALARHLDGATDEE